MPKRSTCWVGHCPDLAIKWGMCGDHQQRWETAHPRSRTRVHGSNETRFLFYTEKNTGSCGEWGNILGTPCWHWTGTLTSSGYGVTHFSQEGQARQMVRAHRYSYARGVLTALECLEVDHLCRVRTCVNPEHLEPVPKRGA